MTLTIKPEIQKFISAQAAGLFEKAFEDRKPGDFDALPYNVQFAKRVAVGFEEVTRYIKRLRITTTVGVRYLLVAEPHEGKRRDKSLPGRGLNHGLPHFHMLIHETGEANLTKRVLQGRWKWGITEVKLVKDSEAAAKGKYLCKYLSKSQASRTRASLEYGKIDLSHREIEKSNVKTNDPLTFHCVKASGSERQEKISGTVQIAADAALGTAAAGQEDPNAIGREVAHVAHRQVGRQSQPRGFSIMQTRQFRRLAAKVRVRSGPAVESASKATHALLGRERKPSGPLSDLERNKLVDADAEGTLPGFMLEAEAPAVMTPKEEREELLRRMAAAAIARNVPAARRARIVAENARIARQYGTPVAHEYVPPPPKERRLLWHGYPVHTAYLRPPARSRSRR